MHLVEELGGLQTYGLIYFLRDDCELTLRFRFFGTLVDLVEKGCSWTEGHVSRGSQRETLIGS